MDIRSNKRDYLEYERHADRLERQSDHELDGKRRQQLRELARDQRRKADALRRPH